jgi:hypothetical protein
LFENIKEGDQREVFCVDRTKLLKWILKNINRTGCGEKVYIPSALPKHRIS